MRPGSRPVSGAVQLWASLGPLRSHAASDHKSQCKASKRLQKAGQESPPHLQDCPPRTSLHDHHITFLLTGHSASPRSQHRAEPTLPPHPDADARGGPLPCRGVCPDIAPSPRPSLPGSPGRRPADHSPRRGWSQFKTCETLARLSRRRTGTRSQQTLSSRSQPPDLATLLTAQPAPCTSTHRAPSTGTPSLLAGKHRGASGRHPVLADAQGPQDRKTCKGPVQVSKTGWLTKGSLLEAEKEGKDRGSQEGAWRQRPGGQGRSCGSCSSAREGTRMALGRAALGRASVIALNLIYRKQGRRLLEGQASICPKVRLGVPQGLTPSKKRWKVGPEKPGEGQAPRWAKCC